MNKIFIITLLLSTWLLASPAFSGVKEFKQSDKSTFRAHLKGDEWFHWVETENGYTVKYNTKSKDYEYMIVDENDELVYSNIKVQKSSLKAPARQSNLSGVIKIISNEKLSELWKRAYQKRHEQVKYAK